MRKQQTGHRWLATLLGGCTLVLVSACGGTPPAAAGPEPERVAIGYGTAAAEDVTGSISSVTAKDIESASTASLEQILTNRVAGLQVIRTNGGFSLQIRGTSSIMGNTEPLLVVDGLPVQAGGIGSVLGALNPRDIARVDVLKDAASTAIYGVRGANGVVIITTKRGL
jgi:TonB-dependent SusC/RagA subfamily outer membrane receptor